MWSSAAVAVSSRANGGATTVSGEISLSAAGGTGGGTVAGNGGIGGSGGGGSGNPGCGGAGGTNGGPGVTGCTYGRGTGQGPWTSMLSDLGENPYGIQAGAGGSEGKLCHQGNSPCCTHCGGGGGGGLYFGVESPVGGVTVSNPSVSSSDFQATSGQGFGAGGAGGGYNSVGVSASPH